MGLTDRRQRRTTSATRKIARPSGFEFTSRARTVCEDMVSRIPKLAHIDMGRVAVSFSQVRKDVEHGLQATLTPMRFENGSRETVRNGQKYSVQQIVDERGREMLYLLSFYMPRFQNQPFREKLVTILHELWHISPAFNGDLRRLPGRCYVHSHSEKNYDAAMSVLADEWLSRDPPAEIFEFLQLSFAELQQRHGPVHGARFAAPRLIPIR